jgi:hypothetical protein
MFTQFQINPNMGGCNENLDKNYGMRKSSIAKDGKFRK